MIFQSFNYIIYLRMFENEYLAVQANIITIIISKEREDSTKQTLAFSVNIYQ